VQLGVFLSEKLKKERKHQRAAVCTQKRTQSPHVCSMALLPQHQRQDGETIHLEILSFWLKKIETKQGGRLVVAGCLRYHGKRRRMGKNQTAAGRKTCFFYLRLEVLAVHRRAA